MLANASIQEITTLQGFPLCAAFDDLRVYVGVSSCPHDWSPAFAGMSRVGLVGRDTAVVSRRCAKRGTLI
jgi:hypothetical protein